MKPIVGQRWQYFDSYHNLFVEIEANCRAKVVQIVKGGLDMQRSYTLDNFAYKNDDFSDYDRVSSGWRYLEGQDKSNG